MPEIVPHVDYILPAPIDGGIKPSEPRSVRSFAQIVGESIEKRGTSGGGGIFALNYATSIYSFGRRTATRKQWRDWPAGSHAPREAGYYQSAWT